MAGPYFICPQGCFPAERLHEIPDRHSLLPVFPLCFASEIPGQAGNDVRPFFLVLANLFCFTGEIPGLTGNLRIEPAITAETAAERYVDIHHPEAPESYLSISSAVPRLACSVNASTVYIPLT